MKILELAPTNCPNPGELITLWGEKGHTSNLLAKLFSHHREGMERDGECACLCVGGGRERRDGGVEWGGGGGSWLYICLHAQWGSSVSDQLDLKPGSNPLIHRSCHYYFLLPLSLLIFYFYLRAAVL